MTFSSSPFFADLSTYSPEKTIPFYKEVFGWEYFEESNYFMAFHNKNEVSGLYETPQKFKDMRMPHFWMTYIKVPSVTFAVNKAQELGGIIEVNYELDNIGKVALIRDPQGAGFTIYDGNKLKNTRTKNVEGTLIWNELHVSDASRVIPFYEGVFDWKFQQDQNDIYAVFNSKNEHILDILEIPNEYKGKYEYWVCTFGTKNLSKSKNLILENGGSLISDEENRLLFTDNSGEAFFYIKAV